MSTLEVDLNGFDSDLSYRHYWRHNHQKPTPRWELHSNAEAKRAVKEFGITRQCDKVDLIDIKIPQRVEQFSGDFLMHLLGPAARKLTPDALQKKLVVTVRGKSCSVADSLDSFAMAIRSYLDTETYKIAERAKKKANAPDAKEIVWGEPTGLFVPDIGTKLKLVLPWQTDVKAEYRNDAMMQLLEPGTSKWGGRDRKTWSITINPGAVLTVDRVYIRQGKGFENFSSLTFRLAKGAEVVHNGTTHTTKKSIRFFSNLCFVNKMLVEVDLNSLPGQEKEGTARKN